MKKIILAICVSVAVVMMVTPVFANELWDPHLRGVDEGLAAGALPPPGFYFINTEYFMPGLSLYGTGTGETASTKVHGTNLFVFVDSPVLLWATGYKFLCADYAMAIAQPIVYTNVNVLGTKVQAQAEGSNWGTFNTVLVPYILSWKLPCDFYIKTGLAIGLNDGSTTVENTSVAAPSANNFYDFIPDLGISWLHNGWNISADFFFAFPTKDNYTNYQSGNQFAADYTITKTCGKWTFGLGAAQYVQMGADTLAGVTVPLSTTTMYTMGPIIGYNFGPCSLTGTYNFSLYSADGWGGDFFLVRLVVPLGNPCK